MAQLKLLKAKFNGKKEAINETLQTRCGETDQRQIDYIRILWLWLELTAFKHTVIMRDVANGFAENSRLEPDEDKIARAGVHCNNSINVLAEDYLEDQRESDKA